jgi:hypothetical protein
MKNWEKNNNIKKNHQKIKKIRAHGNITGACKQTNIIVKLNLVLWVYLENLIFKFDMDFELNLIRY